MDRRNFLAAAMFGCAAHDNRLANGAPIPKWSRGTVKILPRVHLSFNAEDFNPASPQYPAVMQLLGRVEAFHLSADDANCRHGCRVEIRPTNPKDLDK
jgi:hypothetical protein